MNMLEIRRFLELMVGPREPSHVRRRIEVVAMQRCAAYRTHDEIAFLQRLSWFLAEECLDAWQMRCAADALVEILRTDADPGRWN